MNILHMGQEKSWKKFPQRQNIFNKNGICVVIIWQFNRFIKVCNLKKFPEIWFPFSSWMFFQLKKDRDPKGRRKCSNKFRLRVFFWPLACCVFYALACSVFRAVENISFCLFVCLFNVQMEKGVKESLGLKLCRAANWH